MFKLCRMVDLTISNVMMRMTGFHPNMAVVATPCIQPSASKVRISSVGFRRFISLFQIDDSWLKDSIFWTTPRNRRTLEKRRTRRFGCPTWGVYFGPRINQRIRVDHKTGEYFELGKLAPQTYKKVMDETRRIQKKMSESFGVGLPKDEETLVVYKGETQSNSSEGRVVEMDYERPSFFSQNLMEREHSRPGGSQETVRPSRLG